MRVKGSTGTVKYSYIYQIIQISSVFIPITFTF